jgi:cell division initiation protein
MLTAEAIRAHSFSRSFRGFDPSEVVAYQQAVAKQWELVQAELKSLREENAELKETRVRLSERLKSYEDMEGLIQQTLKQAEATAREALQTAQREAEVKLHEASVKANEILAEAYRDKGQIDRTVHELEARRDELVEELKSFYTRQLERVGTLMHHPAARRQAAAHPDRTSAPAVTTERVASPVAQAAVQTGQTLSWDVAPATQPVVVTRPEEPVVLPRTKPAPVAPQALMGSTSQLTQSRNGYHLLKEQPSFFDRLTPSTRNADLVQALADEL